MKISKLTKERLKSLLHYRADTGVFTWKVRSLSTFKSENSFKIHNARFANQKAGSNDGNGYVRITIDGKHYRGQRLAWLYTYGVHPKNNIDHINGIKSDNRIINLRDVTQSVNAKNMRKSKRNTSGCTGVSWDKDNNKWQVKISINGSNVRLCREKDLFEAVCVRKSAELKHGYHKNHGRG